MSPSKTLSSINQLSFGCYAEFLGLGGDLNTEPVAAAAAAVGDNRAIAVAQLNDTTPPLPGFLDAMAPEIAADAGISASAHGVKAVVKYLERTDNDSNGAQRVVVHRAVYTCQHAVKQKPSTAAASKKVCLGSVE